MIPMRFSTIFRNRWWAALWAAGIIWLAMEVAAPSEKPAGRNSLAASDAVGDPLTNADVDNLSNIIADI